MLTLILAGALAQPPEVAPPPRVAGGQLPPGTDPALADWTPRPPRGKAEPWELMGDKDWVDPRFRAMNTGPVLNCTARYTANRGPEMAFKASVVKLHDGGAIFDRATMRFAAAWTGGYLTHSDRRFGLLNTPTPKGETIFATPTGPGWADPNGGCDLKKKLPTAPLSPEWAKFRGTYRAGNRVTFAYTVGKTDILDSPWAESIGGVHCFVRTLKVGPSDKPETLTVGQLPRPADTLDRTCDVQMIDCERENLGYAIFAVKGNSREAVLSDAGEGVVRLKFAPSKTSRVVRLVYANGPKISYATFRDALEDWGDATDPTKWTKGGRDHWGEPIVTPLVRGKADGPFAVDTLTLPPETRFNALFFCTGLDFLADGRVAVCTCHGDVWLAKVNENLDTVSWQRYATGLYHPLGLKVVDGKVVVLERGQLTRLHDLNGDGEADFYECVSNAWDTGAGEHSYDTCLETDPEGNFYFFKTGDTDLPTGGCLMKVSKDGSKTEIFCTGFRHPIGMGMSPTGILTGADQEGNWMPATRVDEYKAGGFYGDMRGHHRKVPPKTYDGPLCWLPRDVDNSAGGQVWVPKDAFGPLAGLPIHFSYGRCRPMVLLRQELPDGRVQGGVAGLNVQFLSGVCRGRFHTDGTLYVCGLNGWQTAARADGCVQRMRYTGKALDVPVKMAVDGNTIRLTFSRAMNPQTCAGPEKYKAAWWNYRWEAAYGSKRWKPSDPKAEGQDEVPVKSAKLLADGKTVELRFEKLAPVMQMQVGYNVAAADGTKVVGSVYLTIHATK
jgi:hypothetical protein